MNAWASEGRQRVYTCDFSPCDATVAVAEEQDQDEGFEAAPGWLAVSVSQGAGYLTDFFDYCSMEHFADAARTLPPPRFVPAHEPTWRDHAAGVAALFVTLAILTTFVTGLVTVIQWLLTAA